MASYLFIEEAAEVGRVSVTTLRRAIKAKSLKAAKRAGRWRIKPEELTQWLETSESHSVPSNRRPATAPARATGAPVATEASNGVYPWERMRTARR